ncbi:hypothetical protein CSQ96_13020 [Janthinobacterium sp. BJB412]|nr:hypothetical protein CSQ96_13020 [Janthinobacterium sp. BJB412]
MLINCRALALALALSLALSLSLALIVVLAVVVQERRLESERTTSAARLDAIHQYESATEASRADAAQREQSARVAVVAVPELQEESYIDKASGERMTTFVGVDPGWMGPPDNSAERLNVLLTWQVRLLQVP